MEEISRKKEVVKVKLLNKGLGQVAFSVAGPVIVAASNTSIRQLASQTTYAVYAQEDYFDLAGLTQQEKTLFFETVSVQSPYNPSIIGGHTGDGVRESIILTTTPIPSDQLLLEFGLGPGLPNSFIDWSQLVYYRSQSYAQTVDIAGFQFLPILSENKMGSAYPTASDRIYIYRVIQAEVVSASAQFTSLTLPGCQIVLGATAKEEPEFQYLYRLMRSYELQQSHDED